MTDLTPELVTALGTILDKGDASAEQQLDEALRAVSEALAEAVRTKDAAHAYDAASWLARLPANEYAKAKTAFKQALGSGVNLRDLERAVKNESRRLSSQVGRSGLPAIMVGNRPLRDVCAEAVGALAAGNTPPTLFVRERRLTRHRFDEDRRPILESVVEPHLLDALTGAADFFSETASGVRHVNPPTDVVRVLLGRGDLPFPPLRGLTEAPVLRPDGSVLETPGYDPRTRLIYVPAPNLVIPRVPTNPTPTEVRAALALIEDAIGEFPYVDAASRANAYALFLSLFLRPAIPGTAPLGLIDAPSPGTGKGLFVNAVATVATGRPAAMMTAPAREEEWRKTILAILIGAPPMVVIDNVERPLSSPTLASALTADVFTDRVLGRSEMITVPQRAVWVATGNNIKVGGDLARRCYWIRLDAKTARPYKRTSFRHERLLEWVGEHRGELIAAALTIARTRFVPQGRSTP